MYGLRTIAILAFILAAAAAVGEPVRVATIEALRERVAEAGPGVEIILDDIAPITGTVRVEASGAPHAPIVIRSADPTAVHVQGAGRLVLAGCTNVVVQGLRFVGCTDGAIRFENTRDCRVTNTHFTECSGEDIVAISGEHARDNTLDHNTFENNPVRNVSIRINDRGGPVGTRIEHNTFRDVPPMGGNGRETIQIGQSQTRYGDFESKTLVANNLFVACDGEAEIISNKSSANTYRENTFRDCVGGLVMRGGSNCQIIGNRFGNCKIGIRLSGQGHIVRGNVIHAAHESGIRLFYGMGDEPPAYYQAVSGCVITGNTIIDCEGPAIEVGYGKDTDWSGAQNGKLRNNPTRYGAHLIQDVAPHGNRIEGNTIISTLETPILVVDAPDNLIEGNDIQRRVLPPAQQ